MKKLMICPIKILSPIKYSSLIERCRFSWSTPPKLARPHQPLGYALRFTAQNRGFSLCGKSTRREVDGSAHQALGYAMVFPAYHRGFYRFGKFTSRGLMGAPIDLSATQWFFSPRPRFFPVQTVTLPMVRFEMASGCDGNAETTPSAMRESEMKIMMC